MEFSIATLLANFTDDKLVAPKILEKKLGCHDDVSQRQLQIALDALEKIGLLIKDKGRYRRNPDQGLVEAKLRCSSKGFCFAIQDQEGTEDIYIRESNLSNAWNGDRVLVNIIKEGSRRRSPEGEVRLILERANPSVLARVKKQNTVYEAVPLDDRLLFDVILKENGVNLENAIEYLVHVEILRYPLGSNPPIGRVAQVLGLDAEDANDLDIVCCKHDLPRNFSDIVVDFTKGMPIQLRKNDLKDRLDLRDKLTLSFVPLPWGLKLSPGSAIIDHGFTLEKIDDSHWCLGVHTSDVAHYVKQETPLDREARKRGVSVYLEDKVIPIFPESISVDRCSLLPDYERLALSILITLDNEGKVEEFEIKSTAISVDHLVSISGDSAEVNGNSQGEAPKWVEIKSINTTRPTEHDLSPPALEMLAQLSDLAQKVRAQRQARGGFELNQPLNQYGISPSPYDEEGIMGALSQIGISSPQGMICELTILANQLVASHLKELSIPAIYQVQSAPDPEEVEEIAKLAIQMGVEFRIENPEAVTPRDYQQFTKLLGKSTNERVLTYLLESSLKAPMYSMNPASHFGLALDSYLHCTSPLRRYQDLMVQRVLYTVFESGRDRKSTRAKERINLHHSNCHGQITWNVLAPDVQNELESELAGVVNHLTDRTRLTQEAEADLQGLKKAALMKKRTGEIFSGLITGVQSYGFFVEIELEGSNGFPIRLEGLVHVSSLKDDWYEYRSRQQTLVGRKNRKQYRLGDQVEVEVKSVDYYRQQIDLVAVGGGSTASMDYEPEEPYYNDDEYQRY
jgi:ribonuclease R